MLYCLDHLTQYEHSYVIYFVLCDVAANATTVPAFSVTTLSLIDRLQCGFVQRNAMHLISVMIRSAHHCNAPHYPAPVIVANNTNIIVALCNDTTKIARNLLILCLRSTSRRFHNLDILIDVSSVYVFVLVNLLFCSF